MKNRNSVLNLTTTAMLGALATILMMLEFSVPLVPNFLKLDVSDFPALLTSFAISPIAGVAVCLLKNVLHLFFTSTGGVGELANFLLTAIFVGAAGIVYHRKKTRGAALMGSLAGTLVMSIVSVPINLFLTYPVYYHFMPKEAILGAYQAIFPFVGDIHTCLWFFNAPFNLLKGTVVAIITFIIYKHISPLIKGRR